MFAPRPLRTTAPPARRSDTVAPLRRVDRPITVGRHADRSEAEADRGATRALRGDAAGVIGGSSRPRGDQRAPPAVHRALAGPGRPLDLAIRAQFEPRFGHDFAHVRIHDDPAAARAAGAVGANAFTLGSDIVFGAGRYRPDLPSGQRLIAHELAHVAQQQGDPSGAVLRRDPPPGPPDPPLKEAKKEDATDAITGGLKTMADQASKDDKLKDYGKEVAKQVALPIWNGLSTPDKVAVVGAGVAIAGTGLGGALADKAGRSALSGVNIGAPLGLIPYATLSGFSYDLPKLKTDPLLLHFSLKADDLLDLAHDKLGTPPITLSVDFTMGVGPDGKVTMPFALANIGILPGVGIAGGYGVATDLPQLVSPGPGQPLAPYKSFPQPEQAAPRGGVAVFATIDLLKAPILPKSVRAALGGDPR